MSLNEKLMEIYNCLFDRYGRQYWWPGDTRFEIMIGAILTQNTNWNNVEKAINNLKNANVLDVFKLHELPVESMAEMIRPAGYFNIKAKRIRNLLDWLIENHDGDLEKVSLLNKDYLREELLKIKGIGPETADSIALYAFDKPTFVVDAYTARIFGRHGMIDEYSGYQEIQDLFQCSLPEDIVLYNEYHALIVQVGKEHCKKRPKCDGCPLEHLPHEIESYD